MRNIKKGFTFVELLIALTIFSIIAASIYYTLNAGFRVWRGGNLIIRDNQRLRVFFDMIYLDLVNAVVFSGENTDFVIESEWSTDRISFPTIINVFRNDRMGRELARVSYYLESAGGKLVRTCATREDGFNEEATGKKVLFEGIEDLKIAYCYSPTEGEYDWREVWEDPKKIPRGVNIKVALKNETGDNPAVFEKTVFIPMGELGKEMEAGTE